MLKNLFLIGNVGTDPVERTARETGKKFVTFDLAVNNKVNGIEHTDWFEVSCNGFWVDIAMKHIKKGTMLWVEGNPEFSAYLTKNKEPKPSLKIFVKDMRLLNRVDSGGENNSSDSSFDEVNNG
jgi:single-stranded DNA-binding protein